MDKELNKKKKEERRKNPSADSTSSLQSDSPTQGTGQAGQAKKDNKNKKEVKVNFEESYKRALADYQNLLKRQAKEKEEFVKYANEQIIVDFIPVYDNLKVSLEHIEGDDNPWVKGIEYVIKQFRDLLEANGVSEIKIDGKKFDPSTMEAVEGKGEKIKKQITAGYKLNDKVIVPAKVILE